MRWGELTQVPERAVLRRQDWAFQIGQRPFEVHSGPAERALSAGPLRREAAHFRRLGSEVPCFAGTVYLAATTACAAARGAFNADGLAGTLAEFRDLVYRRACRSREAAICLLADGHRGLAPHGILAALVFAAVTRAWRSPQKKRLGGLVLVRTCQPLGEPRASPQAKKGNRAHGRVKVVNGDQTATHE